MLGSLLIILIILLPLVGALSAFVLGRRSGRAGINCQVAVSALTFALSLALAFYQARSGEVSLHLGGVMGLGLNFTADGFRSVYAAIASFMWLMTGLFSGRYFEGHSRGLPGYSAFTLLTLGATLGVFLSGDLYTTFIFFEIMSLASYAWVAHDDTREAKGAAGLYLGISIFGGMVTLLGMMLLHNTLGTLTFAGLRQAAGDMDAASIYLPCALTVVGFAAKAGLYPLHVWLPRAHPVAPAPASALLSGVLTKTGIFGLIAVTVNLLPADAAWGSAILVPGVITMVWGAVLAVFSNDIKRTLACSSLSQIGFITVGIAMMALLGEHNALAAQGTFLHMVNHSLIKLVLFMCAGVVTMNAGSRKYADIRGFGRGKPVFMLAFLMGALGISGVPLFNGYISKSLIHESIIELAGMAFMSGGAAMYYYKLVEWLFVLSGGMTVCYMARMFVVLFVDRHPVRQAEFDSMNEKYLGGAASAALAASAAILPVMGVLPGAIMGGLSRLALPFMNAAPADHVAYFSGENLTSAAITLALGGALYFALARVSRKRGGGEAYPDLLPANIGFVRLSGSYLIKGVALPAVCAAARFLDVLTDRLGGVVTYIAVVCARVLDGLTDAVAYAFRGTVLRRSVARRPVPVGNRLTYTLGRMMNGIVYALNYTVRRKRPITTDFICAFAAVGEELRTTSRRITISVSFGLLLLCIGLVITFVYFMV